MISSGFLEEARALRPGPPHDEETAMPQLTMQDRVTSRAARTLPAVGRDGSRQETVVRDAVGRDGADVATAVSALEARKALLAGAVAALNAPDRLAAGLFEAALADAGARLWPFDLARVHLLYGEWLRRAREITRARDHLRTALAAFEYLGATAWAERAAAELAATGPTRRPAELGPAEPLTAQERQVAELAAAGLSNKQIAARLYMSHRTVGAHLYRIFPKLGISSRAALRDALSHRAATAA
jgi:DNA-binding CsgD family transcriptional regulator